MSRLIIRICTRSGIINSFVILIHHLAAFSTARSDVLEDTLERLFVITLRTAAGLVFVIVNFERPNVHTAVLRLVSMDVGCSFKRIPRLWTKNSGSVRREK